MEFWKMNGAGNDFIVVDDRQDAIPDEKWPEIIHLHKGTIRAYNGDGGAVFEISIPVSR